MWKIYIWSTENVENFQIRIPNILKMLAQAAENHSKLFCKKKKKKIISSTDRREFSGDREFSPTQKRIQN